MTLEIDKWYLDGIDPDGQTFIGYAARLRWARISLRYSGILTYGSESGVDSRMTLRRFREPAMQNGILRWSSAPLEVDGTWESRQRPIRATLFTGEEGDIHWMCEQPRARAQVRFGSRVVEGSGYTERLRMTLPPWRMPIDELHWGRVVTDDLSVIWIEWRGEQPLRKVFVDGVLYAEAQIDAGGVRVDALDLEIIFSESVTLREGPLVSTVFQQIPVLRHTLPSRILETHETKWRSRATITRPDQPRVRGWSIHEIVRWE